MTLRSLAHATGIICKGNNFGVENSGVQYGPAELEIPVLLLNVNMN